MSEKPNSHVVDQEVTLQDLAAMIRQLRDRQLSPWFTVEEATAYARMGRSTITRAISEGFLKAHRPPAKDGNGKRRYQGKILIHRDDLDRFIRNQTGRGRRPSGEFVFVPYGKQE